MKHKILAILLLLVYAIIIIDGIYSVLTNQTITLISDVGALLFIVMGGFSYIAIIIILFFWVDIRERRE